MNSGLFLFLESMTISVIKRLAIPSLFLSTWFPAKPSQTMTSQSPLKAVLPSTLPMKLISLSSARIGYVSLTR